MDFSIKPGTSPHRCDCAEGLIERERGRGAVGEADAETPGVSRAPLFHGRKECCHRGRHGKVGVCAVSFVEQPELVELVWRHVLVQPSLRPEWIEVLLREGYGGEVE